MRELIFILFFTLIFSNLFAFSSKDYYDFEEHGYFIQPYKVSNGYIFTNNHYSKIYFFNGESLQTLQNSPGCGRYYNISPDRTKIAFKFIDPDNNLQTPALIDIKTQNLQFLSSPSNRCGQPAFTQDGTIYFTKEEWFYYGNKKIKLSSFSNITTFSNDKNLIAYTDRKGQIHILNINLNSDEIITPKNKEFYLGAFSPNSKNLIIYDVGKYIYLYNLESKELKPLNAMGKASWLSNDKIIYNNAVIKDFQLISSDLFLLDLKNNTNTNLTNSTDRFEMNPDYFNGFVYYDLWKDCTIVKSEFSNDRISGTTSIYHSDKKIEKSLYTPYKNSTSKINLSVPYIHQVYDNWDGYGHKYGCCAATTGLMAIMYYKKLPHWDTTASDPYSHVSLWGMYIGNVYKYRGTEYVKESESWSNGGIDDYDWADGGSPSSRMRPMLQNHGLESTQLWTSSVTYTVVTDEIKSGYPYPLCVTITSSGHLILAKGIYDDSKKQLYYHDPYGDKNTAGYPSYDGDDTVYDWPGENNGIENIDSVAWAVTARDTQQPTPTTSVDDLQLAYNDFDDYQDTNVGFFLYTGGTGGMKYWRGETGGMNDNYWWTGAMYSYTTDDYHAIWRPNILTEGDYEIKVYIPNVTAATTNARYQIYDANGHSIVTVDQSANTGTWVSLGTFHFNAGSSGYLYLGDGCGSKGASSKDDIRADKVLYDKVSFESSSGSTTIYSQDFESDDGGLVSSGTDEWQWNSDSVAGASSGSKVWGTVCGADYANHANYTLDLSVSLTTNCKLTFNHWYKIEGAKAIVYDGGNVKISDDGGSTFAVIEPEGSYPDTINDAYSNPLGGEKAYSGDSGGWQSATFDLSSYNNKNVIIRWNFGSDGATTDRGWYIDDVKIMANNSSEPLPVVLSSFTGYYSSDNSFLTWTTASETNISFWNIYRGMSSNFGQSEKINNTPIPANGSATSQTTYHYRDTNNFENGKSYWYWLEWTDYSGISTLSSPIEIKVSDNSNHIPDVYAKTLYNYPNPFNPITIILYNPQKIKLKNAFIKIYNLKGELINSFDVSGNKASIVWDGTNKQGNRTYSGIYFYRFIVDKKIKGSNKCLLLK